MSGIILCFKVLIFTYYLITNVSPQKDLPMTLLSLAMAMTSPSIQTSLVCLTNRRHSRLPR